MKMPVSGSCTKDKLSMDVPLCPGHQMPCVINTVRKSNKNKGRQFYSCSQKSVGKFGKTYGGCGYFAWVDDTKNHAVKAFKSELTDDEALEMRISRLKKKWTDYTTDELKLLLRKYNAGMNTYSIWKMILGNFFSYIS